MAKKTPKAIIPGEPLPAYFHPKDTIDGVVARMHFWGAHPECDRGTVFVSVGGGTVEMTLEAAQKFVDRITCAIDHVKRTAVGKTEGQK